MILGTIQSAAGNRLQYAIDYHAFLAKGEKLTGVTFAVSAPPATIDTVSYNPAMTEARFFLNNGTAGTSYYILATATTNFSQQQTDQINVQVASGDT